MKNEHLASIGLVALTNALEMAAALTKQECADTYFKLRAPQNLLIVDSYRATTVQKIMTTQQIQVVGTTHSICAYVANAAENAREVIHGIPLDATDDFIKENLGVQNRTVLGFRRLGTTKTILITVEGPSLPRYAIYDSGVYRMYPPRQRNRQCAHCLSLQHNADVCPCKNEYIGCTAWGKQFPPKQNLSETPHDCELRCANCKGDHAATDPQCPAKQAVAEAIKKRFEARQARQARQARAQQLNTKRSPDINLKQNPQEWPDLPISNRFELQETPLRSRSRGRSRSRSYSRGRGSITAKQDVTLDKRARSRSRANQRKPQQLQQDQQKRTRFQEPSHNPWYRKQASKTHGQGGQTTGAYQEKDSSSYPRVIPNMQEVAQPITQLSGTASQPSPFSLTISTIIAESIPTILSALAPMLQQMIQQALAPIQAELAAHQEQLRPHKRAAMPAPVNANMEQQDIE
ncbi:hypothetical protein HPB47_026156 [Ixodes persulcatus]|uniref:Uncharacterized protein n=1 Tax=Ixodes persulcatus TaxID=34615 RepID=A0AC60Q1D2_IXOPE|nr:hypothetical protein HPB47_026156 [Ixodes persulcatus]